MFKVEVYNYFFCLLIFLLIERFSILLENIHPCIITLLFREEGGGYNPEAILKKAVKTSAKSLKVRDNRLLD